MYLYLVANSYCLYVFLIHSTTQTLSTELLLSAYICIFSANAKSISCFASNLDDSGYTHVYLEQPANAEQQKQSYSFDAFYWPCIVAVTVDNLFPSALLTSLTTYAQYLPSLIYPYYTLRRLKMNLRNIFFFRLTN